MSWWGVSGPEVEEQSAGVRGDGAVLQQVGAGGTPELSEGVP